MNRGDVNSPQWLLPNGRIDPRPEFTANLRRNWRRDEKLRRYAQLWANSAHSISKIASTLPANSAVGVLAYLETTENDPQSRTAGYVMEMADRRFWETDSERARSRLSPFTDSERYGEEDLGDFWTRSALCVTRLNAHGVDINESVVLRRAIQSNRIPDGGTADLTGQFGNFPESDFGRGFRTARGKMYATRRVELDSSEVFVSDLNHDIVGASSETRKRNL